MKYIKYITLNHEKYLKNCCTKRWIYVVQINKFIIAVIRLCAAINGYKNKSRCIRSHKSIIIYKIKQTNCDKKKKRK